MSDRTPSKTQTVLAVLAFFLMVLICAPGLQAETPQDSTAHGERIQDLWSELQVLLLQLPEAERLELWRQMEQSLAEPSSATVPPPQAPEPESPSPEVPTVKAPTNEAQEPETQEPAIVQPAIVRPAIVQPEPEPAESKTQPVTPPPVSKPEPAAEPASPVPTPEPAPKVEPPIEQPKVAAPAPLRSRACNTLDVLDSDGDGALTGLDRHWRHLYLWFDRNGDGKMDERELEQPYDKGIRSISLNLRTFVRGKKKRARELPILDESYLLLDLDGDGWKGVISSSKDGALALDFDAVRRGDGPSYKDTSGKDLTGIEPFRPGWTVVSSDGTAVELRCPR